MGELISKITADRRAQDKLADDFLQIFMEAHYANGTPLTERGDGRQHPLIAWSA